jgi:hypothetical protein
MSNQQIKIGLVALVFSVVLVFAAALPAVNALTPSTVYSRYQQKTDLYPGGQHICGEKLCSANEWAKMKTSLHAAQRNSDACPQLKGWQACGVPSSVPTTSTK